MAPEQLRGPEAVDGRADVYAFGLITDFRGHLFEGTRRMLEIADERVPLQVEARCWCGARATHNARTENGHMVTEGEVIVVGDVGSEGEEERPEVGYEVLCRQHHRRGMTASRARAVSLIGEPLPFA